MDDLSGLKVLVVEDESSVALLIEDMLAELGCEIAASVARLAQACEWAASGAFDLAVLDINLAGEYVFPAARILSSRGIPFLFSTGYGAAGVLAEFNRHPVLTKPFSLYTFKRAIIAALRRGSICA
jgi:CheY-like chemotaxis protein